MTRRISKAVSLIGAMLIAFTGCNTILDNKPGHPAAADEAATSPEPGGNSPSTGSPLAAGSAEDAGTDGSPSSSGGCAQGQNACFGSCISSIDPLYGCGSASCAPCKVAHATAACQGRTCLASTCDVGYADCNGDPTDGCETDLSKATSCGACNAICPAATPYCAPSGATFQCTTGCTGTAPTLCGAECVDTMNSTNHCGVCNGACPAVDNGTAACAAGACSFTCKPQFHACAGKCVGVTDPAACGPACTACPAPPNGTAACIADACGAQCNAGFADCDANPANGCESELAKDPLNCGVCGKSCNGGTCANGVCQSPDGGT